MNTRVSPPPRRSSLTTFLIWTMCLWYAMEVGLTFMRLGTTRVLPDLSPEANLMTGTALVLTIVTHIVVVLNAPSLERVVWAVVVVGLLIFALYISRHLLSPVNYTYNVGSVIGAGVLWIVVCVPMIRFYLFDPGPSEHTRT